MSTTSRPTMRLTYENRETGRIVNPPGVLRAARLTWVYLHGRLEDECGFDICYRTTPMPLPLSDDGFPNVPTPDYPCITQDVEVWTPARTFEPATLYWWIDEYEKQHGLVIAKNDEPEQHEYAMRKMMERSTYI